MATPPITCVHCDSTEFSDGRCDRCGRPLQPDRDYRDRIERLAWAVVDAAYDEWGDFSLSDANAPGVRGAAVELGQALRQYHLRRRRVRGPRLTRDRGVPYRRLCDRFLGTRLVAAA
jgi:hypothetical protein